MASVVTNWGKGFLSAVSVRSTDPDGAAPPANFYIILIDQTYDWANANPDHDNISEVTGRIDPAGYTGNAISRAGASWNIVVDDATNKATLSPAVNPVLSATTNLSNIKGIALCTANSIVTAKVISLHEIASAFNLSSGNNVTLTSIGLAGS